MSEPAKCKLCGDPMPPGEEMFNYHGYSGNCPKPPLPHGKESEMEWQPIETVDMDEASKNAIIVYDPVYTQSVVPACWDDDEEIEGGQCWRACDAWGDRLSPTHWMPLPPPPPPSPGGA